MGEIGIKPEFKMSYVRQQIEEFKRNMNEHVVSVLTALADKVADDLRTNAEFLNHTFNLRSSLGAVVFQDGVIVHRNFKDVGGSDGYSKGVTVAEKNLPSTGIGIMLIAGEDYALYVEAKSNKWVISGSSAEMARTLKNML